MPHSSGGVGLGIQPPPNSHAPAPGSARHKFSTPQGFLTLYGRGKRPRTPDRIVVMCGDNPPTITGGYANWQTVQRPLLRSITVFQGYDPVTMTVDVRFVSFGWAGWDTSDAAGRKIEEEIETLEWMAGANFSAGPSPYVYLNSFGPLGGTTSLVPPAYQQTTAVAKPLKDTRTWPWVISGGITWGTAYRNPRGYRVWQEATFTLTNYQSFTPPPTRTARGGFFHVTKQRNTALLIAEAPSSGPPLHPEALANKIIRDPKNKALKLRKIRQKIKPGKRVWVPAHQA